MSQPVRDIVGEYFALEATSDGKHELGGFEIVAMAGASPRHNELQSAILTALRVELGRGPCRACGSDQRIAVEEGTRYYYPDVVVACEPRFDAQKPASLLNPKLVVEVASPSAVFRDRGEKLPSYYAAPSVTDVLLVTTDRQLVEHHRRVSESQWQVTLVREGRVEMADLDVTLMLEEIYAGVMGLPADEEPQPAA